MTCAFKVPFVGSTSNAQVSVSIVHIEISLMLAHKRANSIRRWKQKKTSEIRLPEVSAVHHRLSSKLAKCQRGRLTVAVTWTERKWVFSLAMACQMKNQHKFQWTQSAWLCICLCTLVCVSVAVCRWSFYKRISSACVHRLSDFYLIFLQIEAISELCGKQVANSSSFASNSCIGGR